MSVIVSTKLTVDDYINLRKLCEQKGCSTYALLREAVQEHLLSQSDKQSAPPSEKEGLKEELEETKTETPETEPAKVGSEAVSDRVKKILEGKEE